MYCPLIPHIHRTVKALKQLQKSQIDLEGQFYKELHDLEAKYNKKYEVIYDKRAQIITGEYEPTEEECVWDSDDNDDETNITKKVEDKLKIEDKDGSDEKKEADSDSEKKKEEEEENVKGIPTFWLTIFKNVGILAEMIQEHDEPILKHLTDIKTHYTDIGFTLEFHFSPNEYFSNSVLTKEYTMRFEADDKDLFSYEGPEIIKTKGCAIDWKKGKNVTIKIVKKNQKHKSKGSLRTVTKTVENDSFFNFFNPPTIPDDDTEIDEGIQAVLNADFEIGHYIRERIIHRAVLYYTGEALDDEDDEYDEEEHDDEEDDFDEEDEEEEEPRERNTQENPNECKQQ